MIGAIRGIAKDLLNRQVIYGFAEACHARSPRRALLSYRVAPLLPPRSLRNHTQFSNSGIAQEIPAALNELGYGVDIVNYDNDQWTPHGVYDLFIGHAGVNFCQIADRLGPRVSSIYFSTGMYWQEANRREEERFADLQARRNVRLPTDRRVTAPEEAANRRATGIICLGNEIVKDSYSDFGNVVNINNAAFPVQWDGWTNRPADSANHFLFFAGRGNVHKGLDLLLDAFKGLDAHLHVCQHLEGPFMRAYEHELFHTPNVHVEGFVRMRSRQYYELATKCAWAILPTCAEGQPGSVLECMAHGMIPVLCDAAAISLGGLGIRLTDCSVSGIQSTVLRASTWSPEVLTGMAGAVYRVAAEVYSPTMFRRQFKSAVQTLLSVTQGT